jgi:hypothetical protein
VVRFRPWPPLLPCGPLNADVGDHDEDAVNCFFGHPDCIRLCLVAAGNAIKRPAEAGHSIMNSWEARESIVGNRASPQGHCRRVWRKARQPYAHISVIGPIIARAYGGEPFVITVVLDVGIIAV